MRPRINTDLLQMSALISEKRLAEFKVHLRVCSGDYDLMRLATTIEGLQATIVRNGEIIPPGRFPLLYRPEEKVLNKIGWNSAIR